jgi:hypothetical protein
MNVKLFKEYDEKETKYLLTDVKSIEISVE